MRARKLIFATGAAIIFIALGLTVLRVVPSQSISSAVIRDPPEHLVAPLTPSAEQMAGQRPAEMSQSTGSDPAYPLTDSQKARRDTRQAHRRLAKVHNDAERRLTPLLDTLKLTPIQRRKLIQLTIDDHEGGKDFAAANAREGRDITASPEEYWDAGGIMHQQFLDQVRVLLGEEGFAQFVANDLVMRQAAVVEHTQKRLMPANDPLSDQQSSQLAELLRQRKTFVVSDEIISDAKSFLSPLQLEALATEQSRQTGGATKPAVQRAISENLKR